MDRRRSRRVTVSLKAERISGNSKSAVLIENISEHGIHMTITPSRSTTKFKPGTEVQLKFQLSSGETLKLLCKVRWAYSKMPPDGLTDSVGLEVINPPVKYKEFVRSVHKNPAINF